MQHTILPPKTEQAASRLSASIDLGSILQYAATLHDPAELKFMKQMVGDLCLHNRCRKADVVECLDYIQLLIDNLYALRTEVHNHGCQQFFGVMHNPQFVSSDNNRKKKAI